MTTAYWCVLAVITLPYIWVMVARVPTLTLQTNLVPRKTAEEYTGYQQRAYWAHQNALEAIAPFGIVVIIVHLLQAEQGAIDALALGFTGFRIAHGLAYVANLGVIRSAVFFAGMACMLAIFFQAV
ncbi:MAG: MAPEG family protein [Gammaproteobacteria bacterium]|nr:MAPEG family protein [Gammaproteobacteria bacterium]